jgi:hypothetical protein
MRSDGTNPPYLPRATERAGVQAGSVPPAPLTERDPAALRATMMISFGWVRSDAVRMWARGPNAPFGLARRPRLLLPRGPRI